MSRVFIISDLHLGHRNILKFRTEFSSIEEHDSTILNNILDCVNKRDTLWVLGDMVFDSSHYEIVKEISCSVNRLHLVLGNHCTDNTARCKLVKRMLEDGVVSSAHGLVNYKGCWLSHAPIHPDELRGKFNVYGHTHRSKINDSRYFPVSCEHLNYTPIEFVEIKKRLEAQDEQS